MPAIRGGCEMRKLSAGRRTWHSRRSQGAFDQKVDFEGNKPSGSPFSLNKSHDSLCYCGIEEEETLTWTFPPKLGCSYRWKRVYYPMHQLHFHIRWRLSAVISSLYQLMLRQHVLPAATLEVLQTSSESGDVLSQLLVFQDVRTPPSI